MRHGQRSWVLNSLKEAASGAWRSAVRARKRARRLDPVWAEASERVAQAHERAAQIYEAEIAQIETEPPESTR